jgi:phospholipase C
MRSSRRSFLRASMAGAGAAAAFGALPPLVQRAMAIPPRGETGTIQDVRHVVILMQENRSFDHYFGAMSGVRGLGDPRPQRLPTGASVWAQPSDEHPDGFVLPFYGDARATAAFAVGGSDQSHQANTTIVNGGRYDRWGATRELHKRMAYYRREDLAFYYALADAFTVCDAYHCSTLTQTYPNRLHLWSGCNGGGTVGGDPEMSNYGEDETPSADMAEDLPMGKGPYGWTTYAERLEAAGVSWKVYQEYDNFGDNILSVFKAFRPCAKDSSLYLRGRSWVSEHKTGADRTRSDGEQLVAAFREDVAAGRLPQVSWIVTAKDLSEHPKAPPANGENVCAGLVKALVDHPEVFARTVFILNYDEAGGFFDHMLPPMPPLSAEQGWSSVPVDGEAKVYRDGRQPNQGAHPLGLGIRTPTLIVSPWSRGGYVCSEVFDHTSTLRFLEKRFGVMEPNISPWRRAVCGDLTSAFDFAQAEEPPQALPDTSDFAQRVRRSLAAPKLRAPERQSPSDQEPGRRKARPLPYRLAADLRRDADGVAISLGNAGETGAVFNLFDETGRLAPQRYTLGPKVAHSARPWRGALEGYRLTLMGPNGFHRSFAGLAAEREPEVALVEQPSGHVALAFRNDAAEPVAFAVQMGPEYPLVEGVARRELTVPPGQAVDLRWDLSASDGWYDLAVTIPGQPSYLRRFAGHVETGRPSRTDPAIGRMRL